MKRLSYRYQRTLAGPAEVRGVGFLTGAAVRIRFLPAPANAGVVFVRTDLRPRAYLPAHVSQVTGSSRRTTLGRPPAQIGLVEHVLAALAGLRIDNCHVELNAPEPPGLDGSARAFVDALIEAGTCLQTARRAVYAVDESVVLTAGGASLALHPPTSDGLTISYFLDYGLGSSIGRQVHTAVVTPGQFAESIAPSRTFILESEAEELRRQGLGSRTTPADLLVFGPRGPIGNRLRFANEPARHKVLDLVGDLSLLGFDLCGHVTAYRSGHPLNVALARTLHERLTASCGCGTPLAA
ncbi:MAG TPA: UDP-3-O-acyl-N-acetylglucosamine deacetylase [Gemmataceae bacterium]|nr:UDP-3-O-acyl-N-acetylglucosamine deacetylase [Gemmataceae bacterium]